MSYNTPNFTSLYVFYLSFVKFSISITELNIDRPSPFSFLLILLVQAFCRPLGLDYLCVVNFRGRSIGMFLWTINKSLGLSPKGRDFFYD